jgi:hypothetical protein
MSQVGQSRSFGDVASMSALPPESGSRSALLRCRKSANSGCEQPQQSDPLFNQLVGKASSIGGTI